MRRLLIIPFMAAAGAVLAANEPGASSPAAKPGLTTDCSNLVADARKECEAKRAADQRDQAHLDATKHALDTPEQKAAEKAREKAVEQDRKPTQNP
jgi:hypothetical protein